MEGFFSLKPPPPRNFQFSFILSFKNFGFWDPPSLSEFPMTFLGVQGMDIFWKRTIIIIVDTVNEQTNIVNRT